jgi:hypothetical protein
VNALSVNAPYLVPPEASSIPVGSPDRARRVPAGILVQGWAIDPDTVAPIETMYYAGAFGNWEAI